VLGNCDLCKLQLHHGTVSAIKNLIENVLLDYSVLISSFHVLVFDCWAGTVLFLIPWMARRTLIVGFPLAQYDSSSFLQLLLS